jgi:hypothetical protein
MVRESVGLKVVLVAYIGEEVGKRKTSIACESPRQPGHRSKNAEVADKTDHQDHEDHYIRSGF